MLKHRYIAEQRPTLRRRPCILARMIAPVHLRRQEAVAGEEVFEPKTPADGGPGVVVRLIDSDLAVRGSTWSDRFSRGRSAASTMSASAVARRGIGWPCDPPVPARLPAHPPEVPRLHEPIGERRTSEAKARTQ